MTRWSLRNIFMPISHKQFSDYTEQFKKAAEQSFDTACKLKIRVLNAPKVYTTFWDDDIQGNLDSINDANTLLETENIAEVTKELWKKAGYVEVMVRPENPDAAPDHAFGHAEFKGNLSRQATFYIQPDGEGARDDMVSQARGKLVGDGFSSNGTRSGAIPSSLMGLGLRF